MTAVATPGNGSGLNHWSGARHIHASVYAPAVDTNVWIRARRCGLGLIKRTWLVIVLHNRFTLPVVAPVGLTCVVGPIVDTPFANYKPQRE